MASRCGNDIVDLQCVSNHPRFLERIVAKEEKSFSSPSIQWHLWAAKEAAYKLIKKMDPFVPFLPKSFVCDSTLSICRYKDQLVHISYSITPDYVHACAYTSSTSSPIIRIELIGSAEESEAVRAIALELLKEQGYRDVCVKGKPPWVDQQGEIVRELDISLSHDGRFGAVSLSKTAPS